MQDAIEAGDYIKAIIRGTGINQDGRTAGISLPSSEAQAKLIKSVYKAAGLNPADTKFIEAHGAGTTAGDPLEAAAFASTVAQKATPEEPLCIGSAKSNFGHLEGVSGIVSLIKAALMLEHKVLLPNANFQNANPKIGSLNTQLRVGVRLPQADCLYLSCNCWTLQLSLALLCRPQADYSQVLQCPQDWSSTGARRVSINNLGFGGANAHAILEEAPRPVSRMPRDSESPQASHWQNGINGTKPSSLDSGLDTQNLFVITAHDESTVKRQIVSISTYLERRRNQHNTLLLPRLAFTLGQRRSLLPWKVALVASTVDELITKLGSAGSTAIRSSRAPNLGFVFTGQGANWQGMGRELFQVYPVFSSAMVAADKFLTALGASWSLNGDMIYSIMKGMKLILKYRGAIQSRGKLPFPTSPFQSTSLYSYTARPGSTTRLFWHSAVFCHWPFQWRDRGCICSWCIDIRDMSINCIPQGCRSGKLEAKIPRSTRGDACPWC